MIKNYTVGNTPVAITTAGQSGTCWLSEYENTDVSIDCRIFQNSTANKELSKRLFTPKSNNDLMIISADNENTVFYAVVNTIGKTAVISVDVI